MADLAARASEGVPLSAIARTLGIDKSAASRRLEPLLKQALVRNLEARHGRVGRYLPGEDLPAATSALPAVEEMQRLVSTHTGGGDLL